MLSTGVHEVLTPYGPPYKEAKITTSLGSTPHPLNALLYSDTLNGCKLGAGTPVVLSVVVTKQVI